MISKKPTIIVDENDRIIGYKESRQIKQNDIYRVAALWVTNSRDDILLAQRALSNRHDPGKWGPAAAGTVEKGESYEQNILKETSEEIGLEGIQPILGPKRRVTGKHNYFCQWYTLVIDKPAEEFIVEEDEAEQVRWFPRAELERELREHPDYFLSGLKSVLDEL